MLRKLLIAIGFICALQAAIPCAATQIVLGNYATRIVDTGGSDEPFVLIHALGVDQRMWDEVVPILASRRRVITYDVRGHGSAMGASKPFSMDVFAGDLARLLDTLGVRRAHVVGLSMGGVIAQTFALTYKDRVASLALVATASKPQDAFAHRGRSGRIDGMVAQVVPTLTRWFTPTMLAADGGSVRYARQAILGGRPDEWEASWMAMAGMQVYDRLGEIDTPVKVIAGDLDVSCPPSLMHKDIAARIPHATMHVIPGASHMVSLTRPAELAAILLQEGRQPPQ